jgi:glycosyltransferase involved in cell wall biosynthesis
LIATVLQRGAGLTDGVAHAFTSAMPALSLNMAHSILHVQHAASHSVSHICGVTPLVTIAIPTFNRASWLGDCIRSALAQSYQRLEVLVSDNASTDETALVLSRFSDERLRVVRQPTNIGANANWNACLAEAKGAYIVFLPDDDRISPWLLERCVALIGREPKIPVVMALGEAHVVARDRLLPARTSQKLGTGIWDGVEILEEYLKGRISVQGCTTVLRTEVLRACGGFPKGWPFAADLATHLPPLLSGKAGFINEPCGTYSIHETRVTSNLALASHLEDVRKLVDLITDTAEDTIKDEKTRRKLQWQARRYLARHAIGIIDSHRTRGARLRELRPLLWEWRRRLIHVGTEDLLGVTRLIALLLIPAPLIVWLRLVKQKLL